MCENLGTSESPREYIISKPDELLSVKEYFKGRNILITGVTGFMGKVLIEKLLWTCEDIGKVYVMLRGKKGNEPMDRLNKILSSEIFDRIRKRNKETINKIIPIHGDLTELKLGFSDEVRKMLQNDVSVVFHVAATVRFEEPLNTAIIINVRGTREILDISQGMKNLKAFVYVSTTYTNTDKKVIEEKVYTKGADWKSYIAMAETIKSDLSGFRNKILGHQPNSYTFTKYLAENVVNDHRHTVPVIIFRPSIVSFCLSDPLPGWVGNFNGPAGVWIGVITGVIRVVLCKSSGVNDYIPCDYAINALILSAWYRGSDKSTECITINAASGDKKNICPDMLFDLAFGALEKYPPEKMLWFPAFRGVQNYHLYRLLFFLQHFFPGMLFDILFALKGVDFRIVPIYRKVYMTNICHYYFTINEWLITTKNYYILNDMKHPEDKDTFAMAAESMDNVEASYVMIEGFKKYILKENFDEESIKKARKNFERMYILDCILKFFLTSCLCWLIYRLLNYCYQSAYDFVKLIQ